MRQLECAWCHATFFGDKRHKYCSEECYAEAHRAKARERFRVRFATMHEQELARNRDYYRRNREKCIARVRAWTQENPNYQHDYYQARKETASND